MASRNSVMLRKCFDPLPNEHVWNDSNTYNLFFLEKFATRKLIRAVKILIELIFIPIAFTWKNADFNRDHSYWWSNFKIYFGVLWLIHEKSWKHRIFYNYWKYKILQLLSLIISTMQLHMLELFRYCRIHNYRKSYLP